MSIKSNRQDLPLQQVGSVRHMLGVTLLEFLVAITIISVLVTLALPSFSSTYLRNQLSSDIELFTSALKLARSEASDHFGAQTLLCASKPLAPNTPRTCNSSDWSDGWILVIDSNLNRQFDTGEEIVKMDAFKEPSLEITTNGYPDSNKIVFNKEGYTGNPGMFVFCNKLGAQQAKAILISSIGHIRMATTQDQINYPSFCSL